MQAEMQQTKTDAVDARLLARMAARNTLTPGNHPVRLEAVNQR